MSDFIGILLRSIKKEQKEEEKERGERSEESKEGFHPETKSNKI